MLFSIHKYSNVLLNKSLSRKRMQTKLYCTYFLILYLLSDIIWCKLPLIVNTFIQVVYVARNPRDVCVSYYHHQSLLGSAEFIGDFPDFVDFWCRDLCKTFTVF